MSLFSTSDTPALLSDPDTAQVNLGLRFTSSVNGTIKGIKYYKGAGDTGTHSGSLWSSSGTLLATATFANETSSGWQTVTFSNPAPITAGTTYVASFHSNGRYTSTNNYFTTPKVNGPLTAPASNNGVYTYGTGNLFPSSSFGATNYWVDVLFSPASSGANQSPVAANDSGFSVTQNSSITIPASALLANDTDPDGDALTITGVSNGVNGTASFNAQSNTVTFTPNSGYTGAASFTYAIADGRGGTASATASLNVKARIWDHRKSVQQQSDSERSHRSMIRTRSSLGSNSRRPAPATSPGCASTRARRTPAPTPRISGQAPAPCLPPPPSPTRLRVAGSRSTSPRR